MGIAATELKRKIREFVTGNFYVSDQGSLGDETSLLDAGVIDSTGVLEIIGFLEKGFGIVVADDEIVPENLDCIERIATFVARKAEDAS
jgi:acyl carrier protein